MSQRSLFYFYYTIAASRTHSILTAVSEDKAAIAWKFNRTRYVKKLDGHKNVVEIIQIKPYCKLLRSSSDPPSASTSTTSTRSSRKRKSGEDDALDTRPLKKQYATLDLLGDLSDASPLSPPVASPSSFSYPPPSSPSSSEAPFVREDSCASDATVPVDDASPEGTVALEDETAGGERGPQRVHFGNSSFIELLEIHGIFNVHGHGSLQHSINVSLLTYLKYMAI
ncbi:hypothetical protein FB192DRAFT_1441564 [Mucor lusitanicus]|uniref:Uncharacterized protein n=1 Tax=Mucor circinelloides f. lusitanicus TaxID=29924 RepID=A0A8H4F635_MUCCL|nr:hypothetical protein FB192DRAFT_1441564 [Mucor lusitanicus]